MGTGHGILGYFQDFHPGFHPVLVTPKTLDLDPTKARNGFRTLKIGEDSVDTTSPASVGCQLGLVGGRLGETAKRTADDTTKT